MKACNLQDPCDKADPCVKCELGCRWTKDQADGVIRARRNIREALKQKLEETQLILEI